MSLYIIKERKNDFFENTCDIGRAITKCCLTLAHKLSHLNNTSEPKLLKNEGRANIPLIFFYIYNRKRSFSGKISKL